MLTPNTSAARMTPRVRICSSARKISATGACRLTSSSNSDALPEQEPRPLGSASTLPSTLCPCSGWWVSITRPVEESTPPMKLSPTSAWSNSPSAAPGTTERPA